MANRPGHRRFGYVRKLPSAATRPATLGRTGAVVPLRRPSTGRRTRTSTPHVESLITRGEWTDPARAKIRLGDYADRWITERAGLRPRTVELYRWLLGKHIRPQLGAVALGDLSTPMIRNWRAELLAARVSETMAAKSYRLLRAVLNTAVDEDRIIPRNPCRVRGADRGTPRSDRSSPWRRSSSWPMQCGTGDCVR